MKFPLSYKLSTLAYRLSSIVLSVVIVMLGFRVIPVVIANVVQSIENEYNSTDDQEHNQDIWDGVEIGN